MQALLRKYGLKGVTYHNGVPDFSPFAFTSVEIFNMYGGKNGRNYNFPNADGILGARYGLTEAEMKNVREWLGYTWHECNNMTTMQMIPKEINGTLSIWEV